MGNQNRKPITLVPEYVITKLINGIEGGFDSEFEKKATDTYAVGILSMEFQLSVTDGVINEFVLSKSKSLWEKSFPFLTKLFSWLLFFAAAACIFYLSNIYQKEFDRLKSENSFIPFLVGISPFILATIISVILMIIRRKFVCNVESKYKTTNYDIFQKSNEFFNDTYPNEKALRLFFEHTSLPRFSTSDHLENLCRYLNIDSNQIKSDIEKVKGGNATFIGWGSGGMIAAGIAFSAISGFATWAKNGFINQRITVIENLLFFNCVADYFNKSL